MTVAGAYRPQGLLRLFLVPGAVIGANAAALLGVAGVLTIVPALAGAGRALSRFEEHGDEAFRAVLRHVRATWRRDAPVSLGVWMILAAVLGDVLVLPQLTPGLRALGVGAAVPLLGALISWASAYIVLAADASATRGHLVLATTQTLLARPGRAVLAPLTVAVLSPLWLLAPLTIALGFAVPPFLLTALWTPAQEVDRND